MNEQSLSSISFVISAAYTFTFANAIFFMVAVDPNASFGIGNIGYDYQRLLCGIMCMVMALRFFFGNNQYIYEIMNSQRGAWVKFYQFSFIAFQSVILLVSSYFIQDTELFVWTMVALFGVELLWYVLTFIVDREGVWPNSREERISFLVAELFNFGFFAGVIVLSCLMSDRAAVWLNWVFVLFVVNTVYDLRKNMASYMGSSS